MSSNFKKIYIYIYIYIYIWILDSMGFPYSPRTPKSEFGQRSYDLSKLKVIRSQILN